jgi:hypothetical protein
MILGAPAVAYAKLGNVHVRSCALCAEVAKLKIELREGKLLAGDFGKVCYSLATARGKARKRWGKGATPTGFEPVFMA